MDGTSRAIAYSSATFLNGFPVHGYMIALFTLSVLYIIGYNLCFPTLCVMCQSKKKKVRAPRCALSCARAPARSCLTSLCVGW